MRTNYTKNKCGRPHPRAAFLYEYFKFQFVVLLVRRLGPLSEGAVAAVGGDWGSVLTALRHPLSQKSNRFLPAPPKVEPRALPRRLEPFGTILHFAFYILHSAFRAPARQTPISGAPSVICTIQRGAFCYFSPLTGCAIFTIITE